MSKCHSSIKLKNSCLFSDGILEHVKHKHHHKLHHHHSRQRRGHEWSPSQAIHEKQKVKSQITFGQETMAASEWVFLTKNASTVKAHIGSTAILPCEVKKDSQFGMVSNAFNHNIASALPSPLLNDLAIREHNGLKLF